MNNGAILGSIAIVLSVVALIMGWTAMNRTSDENLQPLVEEQVEQTLQQLLTPQPQPGPAPDQGFEDDGEQQAPEEPEGPAGPEEDEAF